MNALFTRDSGRRPAPLLRRLALLLTVTTLLATPALATERPVRINLGTLAPRGSVYLQSLQQMKAQWEQAGVRLVIYPDGSQGGEADMIRLMNIGTLQAGFLTGVGLSAIEPRIAGLQAMPMLFRDFAEFDYVSAKLQPTMERHLEAKGFVVLFWADAGWVRYFAKQPFETPDDLRKRKIFVWAGNPEQVNLLRKHGFNPVPLETAEILPMLKRDTINAVSCPPIFALAGQLDRDLRFMIELNWAPLLGACVVKKDAWEKIPAATRQTLLEAARAAGAEIRENGRLEADRAVEAMKKRGLTVKPVSPELEALWRAEVEKVYPDLRGAIVPEDVFDEAQRLIREYRASRQPGAPPANPAK